MQLNFTVLTTLALALASAAPAALAATCYSQSGCKNCETHDSVESARQTFCGGSDWSHSGGISWGWAHVTLDGQFATQQECWDGFEDIIEQCYNGTAGGTYDYDFDGDAAHLDVSFMLLRVSARGGRGDWKEASPSSEVRFRGQIFC